MNKATCRRIVVLFLLCASSPWLMAMKCIPKDPAFFPVNVAADSGDAADNGDAGSVFVHSDTISNNVTEPNSAVVTDNPCSDPGVARLLIEDTSFNITCGCVEKYSKSCTIATGTIVEWTFYDGEEHNVAGAFGKSGDKITGSWAYTFKKPGVYEYDCSVHTAEMSDYKIIVK